MKALNNDMYTKKAWPEPNPMASLKEKKENKFGLAMAKHLYSDHHLHNTGLFYNKKNRTRENDAYAQGKQGVDRYKQQFDLDKNEDNSWVNLNWSIRNYATKRVNVLTHMMYSLDYYAQFDAIDPLAISEKRQFQAKLRSQMDMMEFWKRIDPLLKANPVLAEKLPESFEDLDIQMEGDYKHDYAMEMEMANDLIMTVNRWKKTQKKVSYDLVTHGIAATETELGKNGWPVVEYVDQSKLIVPRSEFEDFHDITKAGQVKTVSFSALRKMAGKQFSETEYEDILENVTIKDAETGLNDYYDYQETYSRRGDTNQVQIMKFSFITDIEDVYERRQDELGNYVMRPSNPGKGKGKNYVTKVNDDGVPYRTNGKNEVYRDKYEMVFSGIWIVGSEYIFGYGLKSNIERDKKNLNKAYLPIHIVAPNMKNNQVVSVIDQMKPTLDDIQNYINKLNHIIAAAVPKGVYIDLDALENANLAGNSGEIMDARELLRLYFEKGVVVGRSSDLAGPGSNYMPIREMENGMARDVANYLSLIEAKRRELDELIGFNEVMAASTPHPDTGKAVSQMLAAQTNHAVGHLFEAQSDLFERISRSNCRNYVESIRQGKGYNMAEALGYSSIDFVSQNSDITLHDFGLKIETMPSHQEWQEFYGLISSSMGKPDGIDILDFIYLRNIKNLKQAEKAFKVRLEKKRKQAMEAKMADIQTNAEAQQQSTMVAAKAEQDKILAEEQAKQSTILLQEEEKRKTLQLEKRLELEVLREKIKLQNQADSRLVKDKKEASIEEKRAEKTTLQKTIG